MKKRIIMILMLISMALMLKAENENTQATQEEVDRIIEEATKRGEEKTKKEKEPQKAAPKSNDTGTVPTKTYEDVSNGSKFQTYANYEKAALAKNDASTIFQMSQLYFRDGLYERAVNVAKKDVSGDVRNLYVVAIGSRLMGDFDQSIDYYNRILAVSPGQAEARLGLGIAYKSKGEYSKALEYLRSYVETRESREVTKEIQVLNELLSSK